MNRPANRWRDQHRTVENAANLLSGKGEHYMASQLWAVAGDLKDAGTQPTCSELADLIARTADEYAAEHQHVVVLDDVVAEAIATAVMDRYLGGAA